MSRKLIGGVSFIVGKCKPMMNKPSEDQLSSIQKDESIFCPSLPDIRRSPFSQQIDIDGLQEQSQILLE
jgi:hypothetical protein